MNAALQNHGRSAVKERVEEMGTGTRRPVTEKVTVHHSPTEETATERKARHAQSTGTSRALWK